MAFQLPDPSTPFGERVARRLGDERLMWLTTVDANGTPQPTPVWFLWDEATSTFLIYSRSDAKRLEHLQRNPRVGLNFDGNGSGGDIIVFTGVAEVSSAEVVRRSQQEREILAALDHPNIARLLDGRHHG